MVDIIGQKKQKDDFTVEYKIKVLKKLRQNCVSVEEFACVDAIMGDLDKPKVSGCQWDTKGGGFTVNFHISHQHLTALRLPKDDVEMVEKLMASNNGSAVMSACAIIQGHWIKEIKKEQARLIGEINDQVNI